MLDKINWKPLMQILYPYPEYHVPDVPGRLVDFEKLKVQRDLERKLKCAPSKTTKSTKK